MTKIWTERKTERFRYDFKQTKKKFPRFPSFWFCPIPKIKNSEISEISFTSNYDTDCNSRFKNAKKINWDKIIKVPIWFRTKRKISEIFEFSILLYTQERKLRNLEKLSFNSNFGSLKSKRMRYGLRRKKLKLPRFPIFWYCPITKLENSEI